MHSCFAEASPPLRNLKICDIHRIVGARRRQRAATSSIRGVEELYQGKLSRTVLKWRLHPA